MLFSPEQAKLISKGFVYLLGISLCLFSNLGNDCNINLVKEIFCAFGKRDSLYLLHALGINQTAFGANVSKPANVLKNLCLSSRQTEGPTGPLYASSNPEYLSASDGENHEGFLQ